MVCWNRRAEVRPHDLPPTPIIVQAKHPDELLQVVVYDRVVHSGVHVIQVVRDDRVPFQKVDVDACRGLESLRVHTQTPEVPNDEPTELPGSHVKTRHTVLRVTFECDAVVNDGREEGREE